MSSEALLNSSLPHDLVTGGISHGGSRQWWALFLGSLVQSHCGEGGMLQTNNTGVCSQCLSHTGPAPAHCAHSSGSRLLRWEPSEAGPGLHAPPRSKRLRLRHTGSPQRRRLSWACVLCPSRVQVAQVFGEHSRCDLSPLLSALLSFLGVQLAREYILFDCICMGKREERPRDLVFSRAETVSSPK